MKPVLVTGATGFLGKHLVQQLLARGEAHVRILCRGAAPSGSPVEAVQGDITRADDVARAVRGAARVYHLAGFVSRDPADSQRLYQAHVDGTRNVLDAAARESVERVVVVSTSGTIAVSQAPVEHAEDSGYKEDVVRDWAYYMSKIAAERLCFDEWQRRRIPLVVVNPSLLLGPGDERRSSTKDLERLLEGQFLSLPVGGASFIDARDCAAALIAAMDRGRPGERYLLGGANWPFARIIGKRRGWPGSGRRG